MTENTIAYVGLGSNLAQPQDQVRQGFVELDDIPDTRVLARSSLYRSPPMGPPQQPDYINAVAKIGTALPAENLLTELFNIERKHGRVRNGAKWGPRELDLDLLLYGDMQSTDPALTLPHPGISKRIFVLTPLLELEAGLVIPGLGPASELARSLFDQGNKKISSI